MEEDKNAKKLKKALEDLAIASSPFALWPVPRFIKSYFINRHSYDPREAYDEMRKASEQDQRQKYSQNIADQENKGISS